ncbi:UNVERIFIED_CONTAM: Retrovirus-related Pol polyprotein from transposon RE2 [Sesamum indicum]
MNTNPHKSKFQKRAHRCIFLGYSLTRKGYKVYDLEDHTFFESRDVIFHELVFPFAQEQAPESLDCPLPTIAAGVSYRHAQDIASSPIASADLLDSIPVPTSGVQQDNSASSTQTPLRRSSRVTRKPLWLDDFVCHHPSSSLLRTSTSYSSFVASLTNLQEPHSFAEAVKHPKWRAEMDVELQALERNQTWKLTTLLAGKRAMGSKWVYKVKLRAHGSIEPYKARLVAKCFNQVEEVDYTEIFLPVEKAVTVCPFVALAAACGWELEQLKVNNAILHGYLEEDFTLRLLLDISARDHCLFLLHTANGLLSLLVYVDDILLVGADIGCPAFGLFLPVANSLDLQAFCDADWASYPDSRRSLTSFCVFLGLAFISWKTKKQSTMSCSTAEAEYRSLAATMCELRWLSYLLADFGILVNLPFSLSCDNRAAIHILANPVFHERTKHIEIDCHVVHDAYKEGFITPVLVQSLAQIADVFTKVVSLKVFSSFISKLAFCALPPIPLVGGLLELKLHLPYHLYLPWLPNAAEMKSSCYWRWRCC